MIRASLSLALVLTLPLAAQPAAQPAQTNFSYRALPQDRLEKNLKALVQGNQARADAIRLLFRASGCEPEDQPVKGHQLPNILCTLPGSSEETILIGAHYDQVMDGQGAVDNWTGASLLPLLYESLKIEPRHHFTFRFAAFTDEETGLHGSRFYAKQLPKPKSKQDPPALHAMINLDSLGMGPLNLWYSRSDKLLANTLLNLGRALNITVNAINVDAVGDSDSHPFQERRIPVLDLHSLTQETLPILHSPRDTPQAIRIGDYYDSYRIISALLYFLDFKAKSKTPAIN